MWRRLLGGGGGESRAYLTSGSEFGGTSKVDRMYRMAGALVFRFFSLFFFRFSSFVVFFFSVLSFCLSFCRSPCSLVFLP